MLFFTRIDILTYRKSYKIQLLQYGIIGTVLYYEILLTLLLTGLVNHQEILQLISTVLPGNIFLGMFAYTLIALFLFYTPKGVKSKTAIVLWRCLSSLPLAYVLVGTFVIPFLHLYGVAFFISYILIVSTPLSLNLLKTLMDLILK